MKIVTDREVLKKECRKVLYPEIPKILNGFSAITKFMEEHNGCGIAAPQIGDNRRYFVAEVRGVPRLFINPEIVWTSETMSFNNEACLSVPNENGDVRRYDIIKVKYLKRTKKAFMYVTEEFSGLSARIIQHELDHLNGILFIDKIETDINRKIVI